MGSPTPPSSTPTTPLTDRSSFWLGTWPVISPSVSSPLPDPLLLESLLLLLPTGSSLPVRSSWTDSLRASTSSSRAKSKNSINKILPPKVVQKKYKKAEILVKKRVEFKNPELQWQNFELSLKTSGCKSGSFLRKLNT